MTDGEFGAGRERVKRLHLEPVRWGKRYGWRRGSRERDKVEARAERLAIGQNASALDGCGGRRRTPMIRGRVRQGRVEVDEAIPASWEGQEVKIIPLTPDDALPDLDE